jgi:ABC-type phosphate transport system substrate-binding protein
MKRSALMSGLSGSALLAAAALPLAAAAWPLAAATPVMINGGGAASQKFDYSAPDNTPGTPVSEFLTYDAAQTHASFGTYWATTSGAAQTGLLNDDLSCIENAALNQNGGACYGTTIGGPEAVHYAVSESVLTPAQLDNWATSSVGQSEAGNLIQLPALGTGLAILVNDGNITSNGKLTLSDNDLCQIFSGGITDFSQIHDSATVPAEGTIQLLYRSDSAGTTFLLTNHLSAVCNVNNTAPGVTFTATSSFTSLFAAPSIAVQIPNAVGISGLSTLANTMAGLTSRQYPQAISYISPDWTSLDSATSSAKLSNGKPSPLIVAALFNGRAAYLPTLVAIQTALANPAVGTQTTPPTTAAEGANPVNWVPVIQVASRGYPIVGYSTIDVPQCYSNKTIQAGVIGFLRSHYNLPAYRTIQHNNGLVAVSNSLSAPFAAAIRQNLLSNVNGWNTDIGDAAVCSAVVGR